MWLVSLKIQKKLRVEKVNKMKRKRACVAEKVQGLTEVVSDLHFLMHI